MALQEDPTKSFGSTSYFQNKDDERKAVNAVRQEERQKRIATQLLRRNMKKAMRKGEDGGRFIQSAKAAELDIFGRTGLGEEAGQAMARARYDVNQNFDTAAKAKAQLEAGVGADGKPVLDANGKPVVGQQVTPQQAGGVAATQQATTTVQPENKTPKPTAPDWAKDVQGDRTFKDVNFEDPATLAKLQGMTRAEAYDMLRKEQAAKFMAQRTQKGNELIAGEQATKAKQQESFAAQQALRGKLDSLYADPKAFKQQQEKERNQLYANVAANEQFANTMDAYSMANNAMSGINGIRMDEFNRAIDERMGEIKSSSNQAQAQTDSKLKSDLSSIDVNRKSRQDKIANFDEGKNAALAAFDRAKAMEEARRQLANQDIKVPQNRFSTRSETLNNLAGSLGDSIRTTSLGVQRAADAFSSSAQVASRGVQRIADSIAWGNQQIVKQFSY